MNKGDKVGLASTFEALMKLLKNKIFYKLERTSEELEEVVGGLGKNKLHNTSISGWAQQIRYFTNTDGSMKFVAGNRQLARANVILNDHVVITEDMILSGCAAGGAAGTYKLQIKRNDDDSVYADDIGSGVNVPVSTFGNGTCTVQVCLYKNLELSQDIMFYPMLIAANVVDDTFEPYYSKLELGTAASLDVASSGDATSSQVVKGNDSRLMDSRTPTSHTHTKADITDFPTIPSAYTSNPAMNGTASAGSSSNYSRGDHVHPKDTSKMNVSGGTFTGDVYAGGSYDFYVEMNDSESVYYKGLRGIIEDLENGFNKRNKIFYCECSTAAATSAKTVTLSAPNNNYTPVAGDLFVIRFSNGNSAASPTLNINSKGAKTWREDFTTGTYGAGYPSAAKNFLIRYDGTNFYTVASDAPYRSYCAEKIYIYGAGANGTVTAQTTDPGAGSSLTTGNVVLVYEA